MPRLDRIATGEKIGNIIDEAVTIQGGATTSTTPAIRGTREDSSTATAPPVLALRRTSSGTPANGIGASFDFEVETAAGNIEVGACIQAVTTDVTAASEDFDLLVKLMAAGAAAAEILRIKSTGGITQAAVGGLVNTICGTIIRDGSAEYLRLGSNQINANSNTVIRWTNSTTSADGALVDFGLIRHADGVGQFNKGVKDANILGLVGVGAAIASATALPVPTGRICHVTGTTTVTSITTTNLASGVYTLIFDGVLTFTDGNNLKLAGNFTTAADSTITLVFDGTNFYEICRSTN